MRNDLTERWNELKSPPTERIEILSALLDSASITPATIALYETISAKLSARQPINQVCLVMLLQYIYITFPLIFLFNLVT